MHFYSMLGLVAVASAAAMPVDVSKRQFGRTSFMESEFSQSSTCGKVVFVWARGSTEIGNMGTVIGPPLGDQLRTAYAKDLQIEGVSYGAEIAPNLLPGGTDQVSWGKMKKIFEDVNRRCPNAIIAAGGYSQGAAVVHRSIEGLSSAVKDQIAGVVTFGDTQKVRDHGVIPNFPPEKLKVFCGSALLHDTVCDGNLQGATLAPHLSYGSFAVEAGKFLIGKVNGARGAKA